MVPQVQMVPQVLMETQVIQDGVVLTVLMVQLVITEITELQL